MEQEFIIVDWAKGKRKLYKAVCNICSTDRGYKKPSRLIGSCNSCSGKIKAGTLGIIKQCIECKTTEVKDKNKDWFAGPICGKCYSKEYRKENKQKIRELINGWRKSNPERHQAAEKQWRTDNKEHKSAVDKVWKENNKERTLRKSKERHKERLKTDVNYKLSCSLRHRLNMAIKNNQKIGSAIEELGCSVEELKRYIESKFQIDMNWNNYGLKGWHIDHIRPLSSFNLSDIEEFKKACHYSNLQPLWWRDNIVKGDKYER